MQLTEDEDGDDDEEASPTKITGVDLAKSQLLKDSSSSSSSDASDAENSHSKSKVAPEKHVNDGKESGRSDNRTYIKGKRGGKTAMLRYAENFGCRQIFFEIIIQD